MTKGGLRAKLTRAELDSLTRTTDLRLHALAGVGGKPCPKLDSQRLDNVKRPANGFATDSGEASRA